MRSDRPRRVRHLLIATVAVVAAAVAWNLRRTGGRPETPQARGEGGTKVEEMFFVRFEEGGRPVEVRAKAMTADPDGTSMQLQLVEARLPFVAEGRQVTATIRADRGDYQPQPVRASFAGNVSVRTDDGMELDTERLEYDSEKAEARTAEPVRFRRGRASGSSVGMRYRDGSQLELWAEVTLRIERDAAAPIEIEAGTANVSRAENRIYLNEGVRVRQGGREIRCGRLQLNMAREFRVIEHAAAIEDVVVRFGGPAEGMPGGAMSSPGEKVLRCRRLNVAFDPDGRLAQATAVNPAQLELLPGVDAPEFRRVEAQRLTFDFDDQERLERIGAFSGAAAHEVQTVVLTGQADPARPTAVRRVECKMAVVDLDPESGMIAQSRFSGQVVFAEPGRRAWADESLLDGATGRATLSGREPRIVDETEGSELRARRIEVGMRTRDIEAAGSVRHTVAGRKGTAGPLGGDEPTVVAADRLAFESVGRVARYTGNVVMRSGKDEIRAPSITIAEPAVGHRRLDAAGGVASTFQPRPGRGDTKPPALLRTRSRELHYEEAAHRLVYTGEVQMHQGDIETSSPETVVLLDRADGRVERMLAGSPVEVRQGERRAKGERATYTPADETLVLVGERVVVTDADRRLEGRVLVFQVGSGTIRLDGRDEVRSEAVLKRREPSRP